MAKPFGFVASTISIISVFTAYVNCFKYIQFGRHFG
jgi:hypothetical protein